MQITTKIACPVCHKGEVTQDMWGVGCQKIIAYSPCSNSSCPSFLPSKEEAEIKEAMAKLTPKERIAYFMLDKTVDALYEAGVDVSYFPHKAHIVLLQDAFKANPQTALGRKLRQTLSLEEVLAFTGE